MSPAELATALDRAAARGWHQHREEMAAFAEWLVRRVTPLQTIVEIGMLHGGTTDLWCQLVGEGGRVVGIDLPDGTFGGAAHHYSWERCEERNLSLREAYPQFCGVLGDSHSTPVLEKVGRLLDGRTADLLFIDGDHTLPGVASDFAMYGEWVRPGGVVAFHDVNDTTFHANAGCLVHEFWKDLRLVRDGNNMHTFSIGGEWGGIGAVVMMAEDQ